MFRYPQTECQWTGLKDKNEKEIYEGDIVQSKYVLGNTSIQGVICYEYASFVIDMGKAMKHEINWNVKEHLSVIGNIYENPELLKEANEQ